VAPSKTRPSVVTITHPTHGFGDATVRAVAARARARCIIVWSVIGGLRLVRDETERNDRPSRLGQQ
jgi:hypothetical protein